MLNIETFVVGPLPNNLYLLHDDEAGEAVVIDPSIGSDAAMQRMKSLQSSGVLLSAIWNTHGHFDHIYDNALWQQEFAAPLVMHAADNFLLERLAQQSLWFGMAPPERAVPDATLEDGQTVYVGNHVARVIHLPGHSPGSVGFFFENEGICISGDVLFRGSVGRTDLPGCSPDELQISLRKLAALPAATRILSGHGDETTIEHELAHNPYLRD